MPAPTSTVDEITQRRNKMARTCGLRLSYELAIEQHGPDCLGHVRPKNRRAREAERAAARAAWLHLAQNNLVGIFPEWLSAGNAAAQDQREAVA